MDELYIQYNLSFSIKDYAAGKVTFPCSWSTIRFFVCDVNFD